MVESMKEILGRFARLFRKSQPPTSTDEELTPIRRMTAAIRDDDLDKVLGLLDEFPDLLHYSSTVTPTLLCPAACSGSYKVASHLIKLGIDVNKTDPKGLSSALQFAISYDHTRMVAMLLKHGADPNICRPVFRAIRSDDESTGIEIIKMLIKHGLDLQKTYLHFGDPMTAVEFAEQWGKHQVAEYLRNAIDRH